MKIFLSMGRHTEHFSQYGTPYWTFSTLWDTILDIFFSMGIQSGHKKYAQCGHISMNGTPQLTFFQGMAPHTGHFPQYGTQYWTFSSVWDSKLDIKSMLILDILLIIGHHTEHLSQYVTPYWTFSRLLETILDIFISMEIQI